MTFDDIDAVMDIESRAYDYGWTVGIFNDCLRVGYECWVLAVDDVLVGYGVMSFAPGEAHILNICVDRKRRRRGYARVLMERLIMIATDHGALQMWLEVRPSNRAAQHLYKILGFQKVARRRAYYPSDTGREDALVLSRRLAVSPR